MAESNVTQFPPNGPQKPDVEPELFFLEIPAEHPQMSPNPRTHYASATARLKDQINNLETVEQLAAIDEENNIIHAMSYGITAVLEKLRDVLKHFEEMNELIRPWAPKEKGGAE